MLDILSPTTVDLTERGHIEVDGVCHAYLYITGYGYSTDVTQQSGLNFKITGVLLDMESPGMDFSLKAFCQEILRTSALSQDRIVESLLQARV